jgi:hypothetical protein
MANFLLKNRKNRFFHVTKIFLDFFNIFFGIYAWNYPRKMVFILFYQASQEERGWNGRGRAMSKLLGIDF